MSSSYTQIIDGCKYAVLRTTKGCAMVHAGDCSNKIHYYNLPPNELLITIDTTSGVLKRVTK